MDTTNIQKIIPRQQALAEGLPRYFTGRRCRHGHIDTRSVKSFLCRSCSRMRNAGDRKEGFNKKVREREKRRKEKYPWTALFKFAQDRARTKKLPFTITPKWAEERWTGKCELTGKVFVLDNKKANVFSPSLDRINPKEGYTPENCRFILFGVNLLKHAGTDENMFIIAHALISKQQPL